MNFRLPGPTPIPSLVQSSLIEALANPIGHKSDEFKSLLQKVVPKLQKIFQTKNDLFILTCSGTGGMQAAFSNFFSPGDYVLISSCGIFGDRFCNLAANYKLKKIVVGSAYGHALSAGLTRAWLKLYPEIKAVVIVHNETSTGITNPLYEIASVVREFNKLLIVDAISSLGGIPVRTDEWDLDVVITASQKCLMCPPGLAVISVSPRAWGYYRQSSSHDFYFDLGKAKRAYYDEGVTPWTPNVPCIRALNAASNIILTETLPRVFERHKRLGELTRTLAQSLGLELFADQQYASDTVTAIKVPAKINDATLRKTIKEKHGIIVAGGQENLKGKVFRIGHMGWCWPEDIEEVFGALNQILGG